MEARPPCGDHAARIYNAAWTVRATRRPHQTAQRARAIHALGLACREAFNSTEDFEPLLVAIVDGLTPDELRRAPYL